jgi:large subunit ribosomal protein L13
MQRQTFLAKTGQVAQGWHVIDAKGQVLGRLATKVATILMGKHRPTFTRHVDTGEFVVVINAKEVVMTGRKAEQKFYQTYSRHPGGQRSVSYGELREKKPEMLLEVAIRRMLPKNDLSRRMMKKLKVYPGADHPHASQQPQALTL